MKTLLSILVIGFGIIFSDSFSFSNPEDSHGGRCTGSANCSACSNCSRCGHCGSGGTCGVCSGSSSGRNFYSVPRKKHKTSSYRSYSTSSSDFYSSEKKMKTKKESAPKVKHYNMDGERKGIVKTITDIANIRKLPAKNAKIIEKVTKGTELILLQNSGKWLKVKVKKSGKTGFVYYKNVK